MIRIISVTSLLLSHLLSQISHAQELKVYRVSTPAPENLWTAWEALTGPWLYFDFGQPWDRADVRVTNIEYGGSYNLHTEYHRSPEARQWIESLGTGH